eukprot:6559047-Pyramimonas_sp.AAC.1
MRKFELQMSYRVVWHSNPKEIIRHASLKYLDARTGFRDNESRCLRVAVACKLLSDSSSALPMYVTS